ncbi:Endoribonuclease L-PSP [Hafnia alvei]|uniref:Endoribonuclease L-PSP n=1 Tax=Hafnia alvei TaxID=569 RepID=A0A377PIS5_HAFAL|nr:Endoribonuclease L-PSP [Hafnia alvei]
MSIERINPEKRWSDATVFNDTIYYTSVPENLDDDATSQTANALAAIDMILNQLGTDKTRILDATIFLADGDDFQAMERRVGCLGARRQSASAPVPFRPN